MPKCIRELLWYLQSKLKKVVLPEWGHFTFEERTDRATYEQYAQR